MAYSVCVDVWVSVWGKSENALGGENTKEFEQILRQDNVYLK